MSDTEFSELIIKALYYYDLQCMKYINYINDENLNIDYMDKEILGYWDRANKIWVWGWLLPKVFDTSENIRNELIIYGLDIDNSQGSKNHYFIKSLLLNSRLLIDDPIQIDINLALCSYIIKDRIKFIYTKKINLDNNKTNYICYYYLIKNI